MNIKLPWVSNYSLPVVSGSFLGRVPQCTKFHFKKSFLGQVKPQGGKVIWHPWTKWIQLPRLQTITLNKVYTLYGNMEGEIHLLKGSAAGAARIGILYKCPPWKCPKCSEGGICKELPLSLIANKRFQERTIHVPFVCATMCSIKRKTSK